MDRRKTYIKMRQAAMNAEAEKSKAKRKMRRQERFEMFIESRKVGMKQVYSSSPSKR